MADRLSPTTPANAQLSRPLSPMSPPNTAGSLHPNKRPRLATDMPSQQNVPTYGSPFAGNQGLVNYASPHLNHSPYSSFNTPQPLQPASPHAVQPVNGAPLLTPKPATGSMGPPAKPDKQADINDLSDLVFSAGVDLKEEESYLTAVYRNNHGSQQTASFTNSFGNSQGSTNTISPDSTFTQWSQSQNAAQLPLAANPQGGLSKSAIEPKSFENEVMRREEQARQKAKANVQHMKNSFLLGNVLRKRLEAKSWDTQVRMRSDGLKVRDNPYVSTNVQKLEDGSAAVAAKIVAEVATVEENSPLEKILTLLSLAAQERIRDVLEDSCTASRARQNGADGVVPPEWSGIVSGNGTAEKTTVKPVSVSGSAWDAIPDSAVSPKTVPSKRPFDNSEAAQPPTPPPEPDAAPKPTIKFPAQMPKFLKRLGDDDLDWEKKRLEARKKRRLTKPKDEIKSDPDAMDTAADSPAVATTPTIKAAPPPQQKMTKKERERQSKHNQTEEVLRAQSNQTAALALGGSKKKYSWMTKGGASTPPVNAFTPGAGQRNRLAVDKTASAKSSPGPATPSKPAEDPDLSSKKTYSKLGKLKEAPGVQLCDILNVLERDGKERKALLRGYNRLGAER